MSSLFWKGMLAFLAVIVVAVGTVALLAGHATEAEFRRYTLAREGAYERLVDNLAGYYATHGSWDGVQEAFFDTTGQGHGAGGRGAHADSFLTDGEGMVIAGPAAAIGSQVSAAELEASIPVTVDGQAVAYLVPSDKAIQSLPLDSPQAAFLDRVQSSIWIAALVALAAALLIGGLLFRSIVSPLRQLSTASGAIATGDLSARAPVHGRDEVAQLAASFNHMAQSLAQAEEARRNQTADVAHELRTPLAVLQGTLEAMLDGVYPADRQNLEATLAQVQTLTRLVNDLQLLALADAGQLHLYTAPLDLLPLLRQSVEIHRTHAQEQSIELLLDVPQTLPQVTADRERLAQVLGNLLNNGLRYVPRGGRIVVRAAVQGNEVVVSVADNGPGVQAEEMEHLFERFWRSDPARQRATGGSGLGLAVARHIIAGHGGRIWAEQTPGGGLTVSFALAT